MIRSADKGGKLVTTYTDDRGIPQLTYTNIPNHILMLLFTMKLTRPQWKLYLYLRMRKNSNSATAWPPVRTIVRDAHIDINSVRPARDRLIELGLISAKSIRGVGIEISFNDEAMLELAKKIDLERMEVLGTDHNSSEQDEAPETSESDIEQDEVLGTEHNGGVMDSTERGVMDSAETINTNITTISISTTEGEEEKIEENEKEGEENISKEKGDVLPSSSPPAAASKSADANINIKRGVMDSPEHPSVEDADGGAGDDEDEDEDEEVDYEALAVEKRRERMMRWYDAEKWANMPLYDPQQEEAPYLEQFLLTHDTNQQARAALRTALGEWNRRHEKELA
jgi:hypothetical protein